MKKLLVLVAVILVFAGIDSSASERTPFQLSLYAPVELFPTNYDVYGLSLNLLYGNNHDVYGVDIGLCNIVDNEMIGTQIGLSQSARSMYGLQIGMMNMVGFESCRPPPLSAAYPPPHEAIGLQLGLFNVSQQLTGLQLGLGNNFPCETAETSTAGVAVGSSPGFFWDTGRNEPKDLYLPSTFLWGDVRGIQVGGINLAHTLSGIQCGLSAEANECTGLQIGTLHCGANSISGCQIGLLNNSAGIIRGVQIGVDNAAVDMSGLQIGIANVAARMNGIQIGLFNYIRENPLPFMVIVNASF